MKCFKSLGLLAVVALATLAVAGTASATITSPAGTAYSGTLKATSTSFSLDGSVKVSCSSAAYEGNVDKGATAIALSSVTFGGCGVDTWSVLAKGSLTIGSEGTVKSTGLELTTQMHRFVLGFPVTTHCIYKTNNTAMGTLTEGVSPPVHHIGSAPVPEVATDAACGNDAVWTGTFTVSTPSSAIVVD
jgi:hypothetical protein